MKVTVVIPMHNESAIIRDTAIALSEYMQNNFSDYEIIFSDDGSDDGSVSIVKELELPNVSIVGYEKNSGKGRAVRNGMLASSGEIRLFTDADLAYGVDVIGRAVKLMEAHTDADMIIGSRNLEEDGYVKYTPIRRFMSKTYVKLLSFVGGLKHTDSQCGFKAFRGECAQQIFSQCHIDGFAFDMEVILKAQQQNKKIEEMAVSVVNHRNSSIRPIRDTLRMLYDLRRIKKMIRKEI